MAESRTCTVQVPLPWPAKIYEHEACGLPAIGDQVTDANGDCGWVCEKHSITLLRGVTSMANPRTWLYGDPEPGPDVDCVYLEENTEHGEREIWWRIGDRWQSRGMYPIAWRSLSYLGKLVEGIDEHRYMDAPTQQPGDVDHFKVAASGP